MTTYLLRLNLDIKERNFKEQLRFKLAAESIKSLSKKTNKVIILSHLGRPLARTNAERHADRRGKNLIHLALSLKPFARALSQVTGKKIKFIPHFDFKKIKEEVNRAPGGSIFLLENLRFLPGEEKNSKALAKQLANLGDRYINDDFATSHRKAVVLIIGGAKMADKISVIKNLLPLADYVLVGGGPANNFLKTKGVNIGSSIYEPRLLSATRILARNKKVIIPVDWQKEGGRILDIGPETIKLFAGIMAEARTIIWNGPMGYFENKKFATGTINIAKATLKNKKAKTVIGGGETIAALPFKINQQQYGKIFISTGGGAMLEFLAGKKLPGIIALKIKNG
ncbi:MAG: phosphoglycerate kinase [Candidatus Colwellbacteria bacterium]|nr:phosphoglycerate kinase [Candidatus Colwellbacteria bacterium]